MSTHFFLDTSALIKYYHQEIGTDKVAELIDNDDNSLIISQISILEFHSQFALKARDTAYALFDQNSFNKVCGLLCYHIVSSKYAIIELPNDFIFKATDLIRDHGCTKNLRHLDAIQLSSYLDYLRIKNDTMFVSSDKKLLELVDHLGFKTYDPES